MNAQYHDQDVDFNFIYGRGKVGASEGGVELFLAACMERKKVRTLHCHFVWYSVVWWKGRKEEKNYMKE